MLANWFFWNSQFDYFRHRDQSKCLNGARMHGVLSIESQHCIEFETQNVNRDHRAVHSCSTRFMAFCPVYVTNAFVGCSFAAFRHHIKTWPWKYHTSSEQRNSVLSAHCSTHVSLRPKRRDLLTVQMIQWSFGRAVNNCSKLNCN